VLADLASRLFGVIVDHDDVDLGRRIRKHCTRQRSKKSVQPFWAEIGVYTYGEAHRIRLRGP
jgi:hypothetical protein